jgi:hypothetical protein
MLPLCCRTHGFESGCKGHRGTRWLQDQRLGVGRFEIPCRRVRGSSASPPPSPQVRATASIHTEARDRPDRIYIVAIWNGFKFAVLAIAVALRRVRLTQPPFGVSLLPKGRDSSSCAASTVRRSTMVSPTHRGRERGRHDLASRRPGSSRLVPTVPSGPPPVGRGSVRRETLDEQSHFVADQRQWLV